jgi:threonine dehydrogenase-like Zn-dependent dehydrogenase
MIVAVLSRNGFECQEIKVPNCGADEILIKVDACGICSGDLYVYQNRMELAENDLRLGHEASGTIAVVGKNVSSFAVGDLVTTFSPQAYADYIIATPDTTVKLPPGINQIHALGEPIACCVHAGNRFGTQSGDRVAIIGCGFMGLICLQIVKNQGANFVLAIDPVRERLEMAKDLGASLTRTPLQVDAELILDKLGPFNIVIEAAGNQSALDLCTPLVTEHGRIILIGYHQSNRGLRSINMGQWNLKAIDVVNGHVRRMDEKLAAMSHGMDLMADGRLITEPMITTYRLSNIKEAFHDLVSGKPGLMKAVLLMESNK